MARSHLLVLAIAAWRIISYERERNAPGVVANKPAQRPMSDDQTGVREADAHRQHEVGARAERQVGVDEDRLHPRLLSVSHRPHRLYAAGRLAAARAGVAGEGLCGGNHTSRLGEQHSARAEECVCRLHGAGRDGEFAAPVASLDGANSSWACDDIFFYDDPKTLYHWPPDVWQAVASIRPSRA